MVRPNGSVIGVDNAADPFMREALSLVRRAHLCFSGAIEAI
jgi:hypothetical protein